MNIKHKPLTMSCDACGNKYEVPYARLGDKDRMRKVIDFAICKHCGTPRNKILQDRYANEKRCLECHVPRSLLTFSFSKGLCHACYLSYYRNNMKNKYDKNGNTILSCEKCGENQWRTKKKGEEWECRRCGHIRTKEVSQKEPVSVT